MILKLLNKFLKMYSHTWKAYFDIGRSSFLRFQKTRGKNVMEYLNLTEYIIKVEAKNLNLFWTKNSGKCTKNYK